MHAVVLLYCWSFPLVSALLYRIGLAWIIGQPDLQPTEPLWASNSQPAESRDLLSACGVCSAGDAPRGCFSLLYKNCIDYCAAQFLSLFTSCFAMTFNIIFIQAFPPSSPPMRASSYEHAHVLQVMPRAQAAFERICSLRAEAD